MNRAALLAAGLLSGCMFGAKCGRLPELPLPPKDGAIRFVVLGDNRGDEEGHQQPVFLEVLKAINTADPMFVVTTGDMVNGYTEDEAQLRRQWAGYRDAIEVVRAPILHTPGNHDLHDTMSARVYRELWGPTFWVKDFGPARIIGLDSETDHGRIAGAQLAWLQKQLETAGSRKVFLSFHQPLYPVDGHIGGSLDVHPEDRDRLHALFVKHKDKIGAVFAGHEHLFSVEERDGVTYYITGGAGAHLYAPRGQGGFYHFLTVSVGPDGRARIDVVRVGDAFVPPARVEQPRPGQTLETWENAYAWEAWDESVGLSAAPAPQRTGQSGLALEFDFAKCQWPLLYAAFEPGLDLSGIDALAVDVWVPAALGDALALQATTPGEKKKKYEAPKVALKPGWNTVTTPLAEDWLPAAARASLKGIEWILSTERKGLAGTVVFDRLRAVGGAGSGGVKPGEVLENWEGKLSWHPWNGHVTLGPTVERVTQGARALRVNYDLGQWSTPGVFAPLPARWDLSGVPALTVDAWVPEDAKGTLSLALVLSGMEKHAGPGTPLKPGWNSVRAALDPAWLPAAERAGVTEVEWRLTGSDRAANGWIALDNLRAGR